MSTLEIILLIVAVVMTAVGFFVGYILRKNIAEGKIGSAEKEAERIIEDAKQRSAEIRKAEETKTKEIVLEAKEEALRVKNETERELKERRNEQAKLERRVLQKEENLDKKSEALTKKEETLNKKIKENEDAAAELQKAQEEQRLKLEEICGMTSEEAKQELLTRVETEARHDMAMKLSAIDKELKDTADEKARDYIAVAIQRLASDSVAESTVSVVALPNDEMKGRIIGREGRNIRAIETLAGVDLIIDDTSEAITVSTFNPVRREIARLALEKLIADGRIHPSRIEEMIEKSRKEVDAVIKKEAEQATFETGIHGINPELLKYLGQLRYRTSYGQNVLRHSIEVSHIAGMLARELGVDATLAKRAGLLHDIGKAVSHEQDGSHVQLGVELARKYKENKDVIHAIEAHHGDVEPHTLIAMLVQAADAISAARPGARRENLESYIKRLKRLEEISEEFEGVEKAYAIQAGREIRVMIDPEKISDDEMVFLTREIAAKIESELEYPGQIKIHTIREKRVFEYAK